MKVGVDLGGSHIGMGIIDDNGRILEKKEIELYNIQNMQEFIIDSISNEIDYYIKKYRLSLFLTVYIYFITSLICFLFSWFFC